MVDLHHQYVHLLDTDEEMLFDLDADPHATTSLASEPRQACVLQRLWQEMLREHVTHPAPKSGRAAYCPGTPDQIARDRLERTTR